MYRDLTFSFGAEDAPFVLGFLSALIVSVTTSIVLVVSSHDLPDAKFSGDAQTKTPNYCTWTKVCELVRVVSHTLATAIIAIDESRVRDPFLR